MTTRMLCINSHLTHTCTNVWTHVNVCNCTAVTRSQIVRLHNRFTALAKNDERHLTYVCNLLNFVYYFLSDK